MKAYDQCLCLAKVVDLVCGCRPEPEKGTMLLFPIVCVTPGNSYDGYKPQRIVKLRCTSQILRIPESLVPENYRQEVETFQEVE